MLTIRKIVFEVQEAERTDGWKRRNNCIESSNAKYVEIIEKEIVEKLKKKKIILKKCRRTSWIYQVSGELHVKILLK